MNQLKDIFNTQFFVILGVVLLLVTCLVLYVEQKFKAYDHKMSSMLSLVSSLAEEIELFKSNHHISGSGSGSGLNHIQSQSNDLQENLEESKLIDVSDDEDDEDDEDEKMSSGSDSETEIDVVSESDTDSDSDLDIHPVVEELSDNEHKIVSAFDLGNNDAKLITIKKIEVNPVNNIVDLNDINDLEILDDNDDNDDLEELDNLDKNDDLEELDDLDDNDNDNDDDKDDDLEELDNELNNNIHEIEDLDSKNNIIDYNKLSVPKLKEIAVEKNLITNTSNKMKKADLLKLLEEN